MPLFNSSLITSAAADSTPADPVTRSLRFDTNGKLSRTFGTPNSKKTFTLAFWVKRAGFSSTALKEVLQYNHGGRGGSIGFSSQQSGNWYDEDEFTWTNRNETTGVANVQITLTGRFRDPAAWMHIALVVDTTLGSSEAADRIKVFVNNERRTDYDTSHTHSYYWPAQNYEFNALFGGTSAPHNIGLRDTNNHPLNGYLADIYFIDGAAIEPDTNFIESTEYGSYKPKEFDMSSYSGNSFHIDAQPAHDADLLVSSIDRNDGDTTFVDAAAGHQINSYGGTEHSIAVGNPFTGDGRAIYFDGTDDYLTVDDGTNIDLGTGDFTIEFWVNSNEDRQNMFIMGRWNATPNTGSWSNREFGITMSSYDSIGFVTYSPSVYSNSGTCTTCDGKWHHIALVRSSGDAKGYVDGKYIFDATYLDSADMSFSSKMLIGAGQTTYWKGAMYDFRISDTARYTSGTSDFDVPTEKFTSDSNTLLLIQPDKDDTTFHDESSSPATVTTVSAPTRTASTPFDAAAKSTAMYFDGNDTLTGPNDLAFGTGAFTIEFWYQHVSDINGGVTGATADIVISKGRRHADYQGWLLFTHNNGIDKVNWVAYKVNGSSGNNYSLDANSTGVSLAHDGDWHHIAVTRDGSGNMGLFIDGTRYADATGYGGVVDNSAYYLNLASARTYSSGAQGHYANCYLYDVRITKGEAKYDPTSSSVTKPSAPFELNPVYIGGDQSGNKNHFEPTNISSHDVMLDTPTRNYATFNPLYNDNHSASNKDTLTEGNCEADYTTGSSGYYTPTTVGFSTGKFYFEVYVVSGGSGTMVGVVNESATGYVGSDSNGVGYHDSNGTIYNNGNTGTSYSTFTTGDIIGCAFDADTKKVWFAKNNSWNGSPTAGTGQAGTLSGTLFAAIRAYTGTLHINAGADPTFAGNKTSGQDTSQSEFYYAPPTGFKSLNSSNLDDPSVTPEENFEALTYAGLGSTRNVTGLDFRPDLVWIKDRTTGGSNGFHCIHDSVRGDDGTHKYILSSDNTITTDTTYSGYGVTSFINGGFSIINGGSLTNDSSRNYVAWNWKAHQSPTSNTTTYTVKVEDNSGDAWDSSGSYYDSSTYVPSVYMEIFENRNSSLVSLGKVAVQYYDSSGSSNSDLSEQTYTLECADLNAIAVKWHYDTSGDGQEEDYPNYYNDYLNDQKITILDGTTSEWTTNNYSNDDGTSSNYSPPTGWANGDTLKSATTSYNGSDTATLTSGSSSGPTEKYNAAAGFTIISYAGDGFSDGDSQTLNHSLGVPLDFVIAKPRTNNSSMGGNWVVWHKDLSNYEYLILNSNSAKKTDNNSNQVISTATSGSQHQVVVNNGYDGSNYHYLNMGPYSGTAGEDYILYGWAGVEGYSKFGKYTGNGVADGSFIYTGFRPAFILIKRIGSSADWVIRDTARDTTNVATASMSPNSSNGEGSYTSGYELDILSNGFKPRSSGIVHNSSSSDYIYAAFSSSSPFKYANAR